MLVMLSSRRVAFMVSLCGLAGCLLMSLACGAPSVSQSVAPERTSEGLCTNCENPSLTTTRPLGTYSTDRQLHGVQSCLRPDGSVLPRVANHPCVYYGLREFEKLPLASAHIDLNYDEFRHETTLRFIVPGDNYDVVFTSIIETDSPSFLAMAFRRRGPGWSYLDCHGVDALADEQIVPMPEFSQDGQVRQGSGNVIEVVYANVPYGTVERLAASRTPRLRLCRDPFTFQPIDLSVLREFLHRRQRMMLSGDTGNGSTQQPPFLPTPATDAGVGPVSATHVCSDLSHGISATVPSTVDCLDYVRSVDMARSWDAVAQPAPPVVRPRVSVRVQGYQAPSYGGPVYVRGYYRRNGTYVRPHTRRR